MNITEAKAIPIVGLLRRFGFLPSRENSQEAWFISPVHGEKTPSFKVNKIKNLWYDHGQGKGGNAFDLAVLLYAASPSATLKKLSEEETANSFSLSPAPFHSEEKPNEIRILLVKDLSHPALEQYLKSRNININIALDYVKEVHYLNKGKEYFAIGFPNDKGGFELRASGFKASSTPKWISTIKGAGEREKEGLNVFEGFIDFLSCLTHYRVKRLRGEVCVLNSLAFASEAVTHSTDFPVTNLFLDNDEAGARAAELFPAGVNQSKQLFPQFKDFNDWLMQR